ncbi:MAG: hypothetical protein JRG96_14710 [Deltaproteobacteria bacterium]|nr:hypothetical protein [Deltaproteobacteria bacterium]MBW2419992.1 hypothetical protein [Deltaproteobacteria bacterium]
MSKTVPFPSQQWFEALACEMVEHGDEFRTLGPVDCTMVVKVDEAAGSQLLEVAFEGYAVKSVRSLESLDAAESDHFVIEATLETWREMLDNIRANGAPDLEHTLNFLTFPDDPMVVSGPDQLQIDAFYRYAESLQRFFNGASSITTSYAA